ncbi:LuxR C-terminal-related transcriptional regulator [Nonomuraea sp. MTCD27]|uniref:helix-turn-helix transcriptional regulator n=1 Tax=Nonomuraea sp. MTCD27 TaxID=1676747 RepID=UPI0035C229E9
MAGGGRAGNPHGRRRTGRGRGAGRVRHQGALPPPPHTLGHPGFFGWALFELIEAAARSGQPETAAAALDQLAERTRACGTEWALGTEACSRALLSDGRQADALYREAIEHLRRCRITVQLARSQLLYGEWLRRRNRRLEGRAQLRAAYEAFSGAGAGGFAERARRELQATGETVRKRTVAAVAELTSQEAQIAGLARDGHTNDEIAAQLFISPRTVEWHLGNVFAKLGVSSRRHLRSVLTSPKPGTPRRDPVRAAHRV